MLFPDIRGLFAVHLKIYMICHALVAVSLVGCIFERIQSIIRIQIKKLSKTEQDISRNGGSERSCF